MRVGLIGAGAIAHRHAAALARHDDVTVVAVCDVDRERAEVLARPVGAAAHTDWQAMLAEVRLDAVFVCTPPAVHAGPAIAAFEAGLPVYLEKPLARHLEDGIRIADAWSARWAVCAVGYHWRSLDLIDRVRGLLAGQPPGLLVSRSYGGTEPARRDLEHAQTGGSWFTEPAQSGGILFELGSHDIDLQVALAGDVESAHACVARGLLALSGMAGSALHDTVSAVLRYRGGGLGSIQVAWTPVPDAALYSLDVLARDVTLSLGLGREYRLTGTAHGRPLDMTAATPPRWASVDRFLDAVRGGDPRRVACTPADALSTLRAVLACEASASSGHPVAVDGGSRAT